MNQLTIFDAIYPKFTIDKPIRLIEMFAGYGSQALALKYLGVKFEHWKICEWAVKSIQAYKDIHFTNQHLTFDKNRTKEEMIDYLYQKGISSNYNDPMTREQISRLSEEQLKTIIENIAITKNLVNVQQVKGKDLEIVDTDKYDYIMTYSFPCQDLSLAGKGAGMSDTSTRSGMLWEVERILDECKEIGNLPQILLMENVPQVHGEGATDDFIKWQLKLESLGYKNYWQDLIATDYGIPQTRNRCFMISLLGDYSYSFPQKQELKLKLKDMLEDNVDEKYYLSDAMIDYISSRMPTGENKITTGISVGNRDSLTKASTLTTCSGNRATDNFIIENKDFDYSKKEGKIINKHLRETLEQNTKEIKDGSYIDAYNRTIRDDGLSSTISTRTDAGNDTYVALNKDKILIKNANKKGYLEAEDGDGVDISSRMEYHRGTVQKGKTQTITTMGGENNGVVVALQKVLCNKLIQDGLVEEGDVVKHSYTQQILDGNKKCVEKNDGNMITLTTRGDCVGVCVGTYQYAKSDKFMQGKDRLQPGKETSDTLQTSPKEGVVTLGNYSPSNHNASRIVDKEYSAPTVMENHGTITAITEESVYSQSEKDLFTEDGNIKRYIGSDIIDKFEEGQMATTTYPNGYGHGPRTHNESVSLNTIDKPSVKQNLRIRKLTPRECFRLMGVKDSDYDNCARNQSNASLYHLAGDSIVVNVLMAIFKELIGEKNG